MVLHAGCSQSMWMGVCGVTDLGASPGQMIAIPEGTAVVNEVIIQTFGAMDVGMLTLSMPSSTDCSFQPAPSMTIVLFIVTALPCQVGL